MGNFLWFVGYLVAMLVVIRSCIMWGSWEKRLRKKKLLKRRKSRKKKNA